MIQILTNFLKNINTLDNIKFAFVKFFFIIIIIPLLIKYFYYKFTKFNIIITIKNKFKKFNSPDSDFDDLLIIEDSFENFYNVTNLFFKLDFNKEDDFKSLEIGKTYKLKGYGINNTFFPYKNIYEIVEEIN